MEQTTIIKYLRKTLNMTMKTKSMITTMGKRYMGDHPQMPFMALDRSIRCS